MEIVKLRNMGGSGKPAEKPPRQWIIQRCIDAFANHYEDWPGYCEKLMTRDEMRRALDECAERWPGYAFRGHNVVNQKPGSDRLRFVS
jgi:hypothetical protein